MNFVTPVQHAEARELSQSETRTFGIHELWQVFRRRQGLIVAVALAAAGAVAAAMLLQTPKYTANAVLMVNFGHERVLNEEQALDDVSANSPFVDSEMEVLRSPQLAERLARQLNLIRDPYWNPGLRENTTTVAQVTQRVTDAISVRRRGLSHVIDVSVAARSPRQAATMTNTLVDIYNNLDDEARAQTGSRATSWLSSRVEELRNDVEAKEAAAEQYRVEFGLLSAGGVPLGEQQIAEVQTSVLAARAELAEKQAQFGLVQNLSRDGGSVDTIGGALGSEVIRDLRQREVDQTRRLAELESTLGELHPSIISARSELENIRAQIRTEVGRVQASVGNEVAVARMRLGSLQGSLGSARSQLMAANGALVQLRQLERDAATARSVYESFLQRYHVISEQGQLGASPVRLVSSAREPLFPSSPRLGLGLLLALTVGLAAGFVAGLIAELLDSGFDNAEDIERMTGLSAIASVPVVRQRTLRLLDPAKRHPAGYLVDKPMSNFAEAFRVLRTVIRYSGSAKASTVIAVTSALPDEGKTTCSLSLARASALGGQKTILIDCDLRRCSLNSLLGIAPRSGLMDVLVGGRSWREVVGRDEDTGADVIPCAEAQFSPREVFNSPALAALLETLRQHYDFIILDCPPVLIVAEAHELATRADAVVLIGRASKTPARAVLAAYDQLTRMGARVLGVVLNCADPRRAPYAVGAYANRYYQE